MESLASRYRAGFERIQRTLGLYQGFVLLPVEAPGREVVEALSRYLDGMGFDCELVAPSGEGWRDVADRLLTAGSPSNSGRQRVLLLHGETPISEAMDGGFRLLNQQRDSLVAGLGCPLLWCGTAEFLEASWERMPDFWSIRALKQKLVAEGGVAETPVPGTWGPAGVGEDLEELWDLWGAARVQGDPIGVLRLGERLARELYGRARFEEALRVGREALDVSSQAIGSGNSRFDLLLLVATVEHRVGNNDSSEGYLQAAEALAEGLGAPAHVELLFTVGGLAEISGDFQLAEEKYRRALELSEEGGAPSSLIARVKGNLANALAKNGRLVEAKAIVREALALATGGMDSRDAAYLFHQAGNIAFASDAFASAYRFWEEACALNEQLNDWDGVAACRLRLAMVALRSGSLHRAREQAAAALDIQSRQGSEQGAATAHVLLARIAVLDGRLSEAKTHLEDAVELFGRVRHAQPDLARNAILGTLAWARANGDRAAVEMIDEIARRL